MKKRSFCTDSFIRTSLICALVLGASGWVRAQGLDSTAPNPDQPYRDRLIDPDIEPLPPAGELVDEDAGLPWLFGAEYRFGRRELDGSEATEHAVLVNYQRDTTNFGLIRFEGIARSDDIENGFFLDEDGGSHGHFTLTQTAFPLRDGWFADNGLGVQRSISDPLIESSYRIYLPSSIINGVTTRISNDKEEWRFTWGEIGRLEGLYTRTFEDEQTMLVGGGYSRQLNGDWRVAAEFWHADPDEENATQNLTGAVEYADPDGLRSHGAHFLVDDDGDTGVWYDGERHAGAWMHRFGLYSLADGLEWQSIPILNNRDGVYYRGDYRSLSATYTFGADATRTRSTELLDYRLFAGASWRLGVEQLIGGQISFGAGESLFFLTDEPKERHNYQASIFYNHRVPWFDQRIQYQYQYSENGDARTDQRLRLDQFWTPGWLKGLATTLEISRLEDANETVDEYRAGINYRYRFVNDLSLDAGLQWVRTEPQSGETRNNSYLNVAMTWPVSRHWSLGVNATWSQSESAAVFAPEDEMELSGNQVFLSLSYSDFGGRPQRVLGAGSADAGIGRVSGYVFYDENGDGRRSPGERGAEGVVVRLDSVVPTITDGQGKFEFWPVAAGVHRLQIDETSVPLPWTPVQPLPVKVEPRGVTYQDLALQKITE